MKALFNCSVIKNVYLRDNNRTLIELEISYLDNHDCTWVSRKGIADMCMTSQEYHINRYAEAYEKIKKALLNNDKFVEVEL